MTEQVKVCPYCTCRHPHQGPTGCPPFNQWRPIKAKILQSQCIHPEWSAPIHYEYLREEAFLDPPEWLTIETIAGWLEENKPIVKLIRHLVRDHEWQQVIDPSDLTRVKAQHAAARLASPKPDCASYDA